MNAVHQSCSWGGGGNGFVPCTVFALVLQIHSNKFENVGHSKEFLKCYKVDIRLRRDSLKARWVALRFGAHFTPYVVGICVSMNPNRSGMKLGEESNQYSVFEFHPWWSIVNYPSRGVHFTLRKRELCSTRLNWTVVWAELCSLHVFGCLFGRLKVDCEVSE